VKQFKFDIGNIDVKWWWIDFYLETRLQHV